MFQALAEKLQNEKLMEQQAKGLNAEGTEQTTQ